MEYSFPLQQLLRLLTEKTMLAYSKSKNQFQIVHNSSHCFDICQYHLTVLAGFSQEWGLGVLAGGFAACQHPQFLLGLSTL